MSAYKTNCLHVFFGKYLLSDFKIVYKMNERDTFIRITNIVNFAWGFFFKLLFENYAVLYINNKLYVVKLVTHIKLPVYGVSRKVSNWSQKKVGLNKK